ncbi:DUF2254 domain-containing protein [Peribacillus glennii]|uniref:DUF2254 domain-containing protein n=1 Tax=Peribacillus glennii TaxID=2303991 RepID=A0A372LF20_9BACI|nr:DUF2254 domain-containing protein [Peribacillus glennii]RFU64913.1 DUF2254 domain-containing protein [Peribacillus glennii]
MSLKFALNKIKANFWITPALYGLCFFFLAIVSMQIDRVVTDQNGATEWLPAVLFTDKDLAQTILSAISTSLLTMTTIIFSSILVVETTFLAQYSPRTLQNFNAESKIQHGLGTFIGGYIYALILLIQVRESEPGNAFIVPSFAILVAFVCLGMFVFLIHHVTEWIKVGNLISNITKETLTSIEKNHREVEHAPCSSSEYKDLRLENEKSGELKSKRQGYIQYVELEKMIKVAAEEDLIIKFEKIPGDYVDVDTPLLTVWNSKEPLNANLLEFIFITADQESMEDVKLGIQKLAEIALRAIAPGKNDPETAINCLQQLGQVLTKIAKVQPDVPYYCDEHGNVRIILERPTFSDYLYDSFFQIRHYGRADVSVMAAILKALTLVAETNGQKTKDEVWRFSEYIVEGIRAEEWLSLDEKYLNTHLNGLAKACNKNYAPKL